MDTTKLYLYDAAIGEEPPANVPHCALCWDCGPGLVAIDGQTYCEYCQPTHIVTPLLGDSRISIYLDDSDYALVTRNMQGEIVQDQSTGIRYKLSSTPCDMPGCNCDAIAEVAHER